MYTGVKTCINICEFLEYMGIDCLAAAGACFASEDCNRSFGERPTGRHGAFIRRVAQLLASAEREIQLQTGRLLCNEWRVKKVGYPNRSLCCMKGKDGRWKTINLKDRQFLAAGMMGVEDLGNHSVVYSDRDGDCYRETAVVSFLLPDPVRCNLDGLYGWFEDNDPRLDVGGIFRIRPLKAEYTAVDGRLTLTFDAADLIKPAAFSQTSYANISPCDELNLGCDFDEAGIVADPVGCPLAQTINIFNIYNDLDSCHAQIGFEGGVDRCGCNRISCVANCKPACTLETAVPGMLRIIPATAVDDDGEDVDDYLCSCNCFLKKTENGASCTQEQKYCCRTEPDWVRVWYMAGEERPLLTLADGSGNMVANYGTDGSAIAPDLKRMVFSLAGKHMSTLRYFGTDGAAGAMATMQTAVMRAHSATFLHSVESVIDGNIVRRWQKIPDPDNPITDRLENIPSSFVFSGEQRQETGDMTQRVERGKLTLARDFGCITTHDRVVVAGYGRWWKIDAITPTADGELEYNLFRRAI